MIEILLVEDDRNVGQALQFILTAKGYKIRWVQDGLQALQALQAPGAKPSFILLDLMMPRLNGWQLVEHLEADPVLARIPVVVMSAVNEGAVPPHARGFLAKPFDVGELLALIEQLCTPVSAAILQ